MYIAQIRLGRESNRAIVRRFAHAVETRNVRSPATEEASAAAAAASAAGDIVTATEGAAGIVTLARPQALNALTTAMRADIAAAFAAWARDPQVYAALVVSAGGRAFCAGGDLREMVELGKARPDAARRSLAAEYALNWQLDCFIKPTVSLIDGLAMGSGVGITLYGTHRVAGEGYRFAMPETGIGLFPDDGVSWAFARMPDEIGVYLALTGRAIGRADAYRLGLVTHCMPAARFAEVRGALADAEPVDPLLDARHEHPGAGELEPLRPAIARCFAADTVEGVLARLEAERGEHRAWAEGVARELLQHSPTSLKIAHRHVRQARYHDLRATLIQDFRLAWRCMQGRDLYEGVRAALIDRDRAPRWQPARLAEVSEAAVDAYFAPLGEDDLQLPSRGEMQAVRA
jgi:enoyl-CoA hydratase